MATMTTKKGRQMVSGNDTLKNKTRMEEVYQKAAKLFSERGYVKTTMNDIAGELNIQKGSLYYYVTDKESLLYAILDRTVDALVTRVARVPLHGLSAQEKLSRLIHEHFTNVVTYRHEISLLVNATKSLQPKERQQIGAKREKYEEIFFHVIREGIADGTFIDHNLHQVAFFILGGIYWFNQWFTPEDMAAQNVTEESFRNMFFNGLLAKRLS